MSNDTEYTMGALKHALALLQGKAEKGEITAHEFQEESAKIISKIREL